jgi:hypothetical protein
VVENNVLNRSKPGFVRTFNHQIAEAAEVGRGYKVSSIGLCFGGGKIGNSAFSAIESDVDRIWIGGDVGVDSSVAEDPDGDAEEIVFSSGSRLLACAWINCSHA